MPRPLFLAPADRGARWRRALALAVAACVAQPALAADGRHHDPLEKVNRATYAFNDALDRMLARPAAKAYKAVMPDPARRAVSNFIANLEYPKVIVNDALQGKVRNFGSDAARFLVNTTIGLAGFTDPATHFGLASHDEDFGQTLGYWGVPAGPYLVLPILGPSDLRDAPAKFVDRYASPEHYSSSRKVEYGVVMVGLLDRRTELLSADAALTNSYDPYAVVRNAYQQRREYLVHDGNVPEESYDEPVEDAPPVATPPAQPAPAPPASEPQPEPAATPHAE